MGWMTGKKSWTDIPILGVMLLGGGITYAYMYVQYRIIQGDIHWNESNQDRNDREGKICNCRKCKRTGTS